MAFYASPRWILASVKVHTLTGFKFLTWECLKDRNALNGLFLDNQIGKADGIHELVGRTV
jgi:hypothetical protein